MERIPAKTREIPTTGDDMITLRMSQTDLQVYTDQQERLAILKRCGFDTSQRINVIRQMDGIIYTQNLDGVGRVIPATPIDNWGYEKVTPQGRSQSWD
jgi:hypothetical protein